MPLNIAFESIEETQMRLESTVVRYDGVPVYINQVSPHSDGNTRVHLKALPLTSGDQVYRDDEAPRLRRFSSDDPSPPVEDRQRTIRKVINSPKLDMEPITLGYFTTPNGVYHASRMPTRKYKQGLSSSNCVITSGDPNLPPRHSFNSALQLQEFFDMLVGNYPTLTEAFTRLKSDKSCTTIAVHYDYYVKRHPLGVYFLHNSQTEIGISANESGTAIRISSEYKYLCEVLTKIFPTTSLEFMEQ